MTSAPHTDLYVRVDRAAAAAGLEIYGALHPGHQPVKGLRDGTLVLLGTGAAFWPVFTASAEHQDGRPDPIDRWSERVVGGMACALGARAYYPFGGPPYQPFVDWALASGRSFTSPSQMLVHDRVGLLISLRGALHFNQKFDIPPPPLAESPCHSCPMRPCLSACPAGALSDSERYDLVACHDHLATAAGSACMTGGCLARLACPLSRGAGRDPAQTAHHMRHFHHP